MHKAKITRSTGELAYIEAEKLEFIEEQVLIGDILEVIEEIPNLLENHAVYMQATKREQKEKAVREIVVEVNTKVFDGDEVSQGRMLRTIQIAAVTGETTTQWKLADNSIVEVTLEELKAALTLAGKEMSKIWLGE